MFKTTLAHLFLGAEAVRPDSVIKDICTDSKFVNTNKDILTLYL